MWVARILAVVCVWPISWQWSVFKILRFLCLKLFLLRPKLLVKKGGWGWGRRTAIAILFSQREEKLTTPVFCWGQ